MKKLFLCLVLMPVLTNAQTGDKNFIDQNYIEVIGKSEMAITPDLIYIKIVINEKDNKNKTTLSDREVEMISKLKAIGIETDKDLMIKDLASNFKIYWTKSEILLSKEYQLVVKDGKTVSKVFIQLESIGISNVSIEKLDNSNIEKYRKEGKIAAIKAAKEKAEALANAIGQNVGRALYIQESEGNYNSAGMPGSSNNIRIRGISSVNESKSPAMVEMDFEKIKLEYSIICRFELK